jgi:nicotinate-nucleotide pyrophosphorylase (carboxylating)
MNLSMIRQSVALVNKRIPLEVSGGVTLDNVRDIAATGVNYISIGAITHSAPALDMSLELVG